MTRAMEPPAGSRVLVICLDTFGDIALRQPLLRSLLDHGFATTLLVRAGYEEIVPFVDPRLSALVTTLNPYELPPVDVKTHVADLRTRLLAADPQVVVAAAYDRAPIADWVVSSVPGARAFALSSKPWFHPLHSAWIRALDFDGGEDAGTRTTLIPIRAESADCDKYNALVAAITGERLDRYTPVLTLGSDSDAAASSVLAGLALEPRRYVVGCPSAMNTPLKAIPSEGFATAARAALEGRQEAILIVGHTDERAHIDATAQACRARGLTVRTWLGARGQLGVLLGLIRHAVLYLGADTGPMHFAAALGVPVAAVFGGGHWPRFRPQASSFHVATQRLPCFGCGWTCCLEEPFCVTAVAFEGVGKAASTLLSGESLREVDTGCSVSAKHFEELRSGRQDWTVPTSAASSHPQEPPSIDVVVPSFNQGRFLREALDSIFAQEYPRLAVYVVDGGSTDETEDILRDFTDRLQYWRMRSDSGQSAAIQEGAARGSGDLVAWLNSDDFYLPGALWRIARAFTRHRGRGLYIGNGLRYSQAHGTFTPFCRRHLALQRRALAEGLDYVLQPSTFFARTAWEKAGGPDPSLHFGMDWDLILRVAAEWPAVLINEFLAASREWDATKTAGGGFPRVEEIVRIAARHTGRPLSRGALYYALENLLSNSSGATSEKTRRDLQGALHSIQAEFAAEFGNSDGFPEHGDLQDVVDLPFADAPPTTTLLGRGAVPSNAPLITVVTPSLNQARFLTRTLDSLLNQGYPKLELMVFDGGSTDGSVDILRSLTSRISYWVSEPDGGPAAAINTGLYRANGEVVAWLNSDDMLAEGALAEVGRAFAADPSLDVIYGNALYIDESDALTCPDHGGFRTGLYYGAFQPLADIPFYWNYVHSVPQPTVFFRKSVLERVGLLDEAYHFIFDFELFARFARHGLRIRKLEKTLAFYRLHTAGKTTDWASFLAELYRFSRPKWPPVFSRDFRETLRGFLRSFVKRYGGAGPGSWRRPVVGGLAAAMAVTGIGNPEAAVPDLARKVRRAVDWTRRLGGFRAGARP